MAITFNDNAQINAPKPIDAKYMKFSAGVAQPYASVAEANATILSVYRFQYLTVLVLMNGDAVEHWYQGGTADVNLLPKSKESYTISTISATIPLLNNYLYTKIVILPINTITNLIIGTSIGGGDIEPGVALGVGSTYVADISIFGLSTTLFFGGLSATTKVILYKTF
jgi:hypothetical protein